MTSPTQPIEHFTMEQATALAQRMGVGYSNELGCVMSESQLHALLNAAINERIGEPIGQIVNETHYAGTCGIDTYHRAVSWDNVRYNTVPLQTQLYTLKELKS